MKSFFTETILKRGKTYFEQNRVFSVNQYDNQTYTGIILGNEAYHTKITLDEHYDVMSATCDCPYAKEGNHCKHEAALYFAIEDRLPKDEQQYIDINALLKDVRRRTHSSFMLKREFNQEFKKYLKRIIQLNEQGSFHITNYQQVIDEFLNSNYPNDYRHEILQIMFQGYSKLLTSEHNKELTTRWLKENMKYQRYENAFSYIMMIIYKLDVNDQIDIIREMLLTKRKVSLLNTYFKIINDHHLDMKKYLDDIQIYNNNEDYLLDFMDAIKPIYDDYDLALMFKQSQDVKYLIYVLLQRPNMTLFEQTKEIIKDYSLEMYLMVYVECLKNYIKKGNSNYYFKNYVYELFLDLDKISKIEFVDMIKKEYPRKKKIHEMLDECLEEGDEIEI